MKRIFVRILLLVICIVLCVINIGCSHDKSNLEENTTKEIITSSDTLEKNDTGNNNGKNQEFMADDLINIFTQNYTWKEFKIVYPNYRILFDDWPHFTVELTQFENVIFGFDAEWYEQTQSFEQDTDKFTLERICATADMLLPEYFEMSFDDILEKEGSNAGYDPSDPLEDRYKYESIYIYRNDFYYYISGYEMYPPILNDSANIMICLYDEHIKRPW